MDAGDGPHFVYTFGSVVPLNDVCPFQIMYEVSMLCVKGVVKHFWSDPECKPLDPSTEELETEKQHFEGVQKQKASNKVCSVNLKYL